MDENWDPLSIEVKSKEFKFGDPWPVQETQVWPSETHQRHQDDASRRLATQTPVDYGKVGKACMPWRATMRGQAE